MWAVQYHRRGGPEVLTVDEIEVPRPRSGQALVRVLSSCVSRIDVEYRRGRLPHGWGYPKQPGFDAVAQVVDAHDTALPVGAWVMIVLGLEPASRRGTTVEFLAIEPQRCGVFPPEYVPSSDDCALALGGLTALRAIRNGVRTQSGDRILVVGAGGPVGLAAIQIAQLHGASVDAVAGASVLDTCVALGAQHAWDYHEDLRWVQSSSQYDGIVIAAGNPSHWFSAAKRRGRAALTDGGAWPRSIPTSVRRGVVSVPVAAGHSSADLTWLAKHTANNHLQAIVGSRYHYQNIQQAHRELTVPGTCGARLIEHQEVRQ